MLPTAFNFEGQELRTVIKNGEPEFVAKDACLILGLDDVSKAVNRLDDDERGTNSIPTLGGNQEMLCVNEYGLYSLILGSRKPEAKQFKRWITHEVIPSIRKTGSYSLQPKLPSTYLEALEALVESEKQKQILLPKAQYFDALVERNLLTNFRDTAKELKIRETDLINWLLEKKYIYRDQATKLKPYAQHVPKLFEMKEWENNKKAGNQTMVTPRGRETFRLLVGESEVKMLCPAP